MEAHPRPAGAAGEGPMVTPHVKIVQYLSDARTMEEDVLRRLHAHAAVAPNGDYLRLLDRHRRETEQHRDRIDARLAELGEGRTVLDAGVDALQSVAGQLLGLYRLPTSAARGQRGEDRILRDAREACAAEALEIATYHTLEELASQLGDAKTAGLAQRIRGDEERMLAALHELLPQLTGEALRADGGT
jgi:ferritin-like metal-binding protein YciE